MHEKRRGHGFETSLSLNFLRLFLATASVGYMTGRIFSRVTRIDRVGIV